MFKRIFDRFFTDFLLVVMLFLMLAVAAVKGYYKGVQYALDNVKAIPIDERIALIEIDEDAFSFLR